MNKVSSRYLALMFEETEDGARRMWSDIDVNL